MMGVLTERGKLFEGIHKFQLKSIGYYEFKKTSHRLTKAVQNY
jgi:hypothetical protein